MFFYGGEGGIRTREPLWVTRFPSVRAKPDYATSPYPAGELYHAGNSMMIRPQNNGERSIFVTTDGDTGSNTAMLRITPSPSSLRSRQEEPLPSPRREERSASTTFSLASFAKNAFAGRPPAPAAFGLRTSLFSRASCQSFD